MDIGGWLRKLGLERYEPAFRENRVDYSILPRLTVEDLKDLGVVLVGDRRRLLDAVAALRGKVETEIRAQPLGKPPSTDTPVEPAPATMARPGAAVRGGDREGERRHLTVLFCDLVGSTEIAGRLDAEEWRDLVGDYVDAACGAVKEMGGHVAQISGDGLLALFGYPTAQENDAERAARAALSIQRALDEVNRRHAGSKPALAARIGIEAGLVVVDAAGEIFGDIPNIAARVQAVAEPGAVLITAPVQRQVAGLFVAEERGSHQLKGVSKPVTLFRLVRASGGGRRSGQRHLTPLVGREEEIALLLRRWERARQGEGQLVLMVGEPGIGKSRLIEEFHARLGETPHTWAEWSCSQLLQNTPLHPLTEWGRQRFGGPELPPERRLADLDNALSQLKLDPAANAPLLAPLLDIPLPPARAAPKLSPEELRRRQLAALTAWAMAGARVQPGVLAIEDLHWADPTTLEVLRSVAERGAVAPLFVLATARPEFKPNWRMRSHHGVIVLAPLDCDQVRRMVGELASRHALPSEVIDGVTERTGGVPLFVEEVTRLLLERGAQIGGQEIPPTLQQSLTARLDRLGAAREVAQIGAVIGRGFSYALLRAVAEMEEAPLQASLERLADADILLVQGLPPAADYRFKHALIQDAAYDNLLKSRRSVLHRRIGEILRDRFSTISAAEPETLAHHFTQAGLDDAAIEWWGKAGDQALRRNAFNEAISHLGKAIEMADKTGEGMSAAATTSTSANQRLKLQTDLGKALLWSRGFGADETKAAFIRARELAAAIDNATERFSIYYGLWLINSVRGELSSAREIAETFLREAERGAHATECAFGHRLLGLTCLYQGDFIEAQSNLVEALSIYDPGRDREATFRLGPDTAAVVRAYLAYTKWLLGEVGSARALMEEAVSHAIEAVHVPTLVVVYSFKGHVDMVRGDAGATRRDAQILVKLSQENALSAYAAQGALQSAWASARLDPRETGATELRHALAALTDHGKVYMPFFQGLLAEMEAQGDAEGALTLIDEALALAGEIGELWSHAFLHRLRGEILLKRDPANTAPAEEAFLTAIAIAQQQKARSFELRAALALAQLYQSSGRVPEARTTLAPALDGFAATPEFPEIEQAQALLVALNQ
jgi:class 3 adenylate cyclase/tetratricopeptide (TPR) repeat protein